MTTSANKQNALKRNGVGIRERVHFVTMYQSFCCFDSITNLTGEPFFLEVLLADARPLILESLS